MKLFDEISLLLLSLRINVSFIAEVMLVLGTLNLVITAVAKNNLGILTDHQRYKKVGCFLHNLRGVRR